MRFNHLLQKLYSVLILSIIDRKSFYWLFSYYSILWISNGENLERTCHACHHCHLIKATTTTYTLHYTVPNTKASYYKGQIISEQNCGVLHFPKKQRNYRFLLRLFFHGPKNRITRRPPACCDCEFEAEKLKKKICQFFTFFMKKPC